MSIFTTLTRTALVRPDFSEEAIYRAVLSVPLHVYAIDGPLDAPEWMPAGSMYEVIPFVDVRRPRVVRPTIVRRAA